MPSFVNLKFLDEFSHLHSLLTLPVKGTRLIVFVFCCCFNCSASVLISCPLFPIFRNKLEKFRVNSAGFDNRYRHRDNLNPHCDLAYAVVYPGKDNSDYTNDENRNNRIMNRNIESYEISRKINGPTHESDIDSFFEVSSEL
jgi:hypothetical protein